MDVDQPDAAYHGPVVKDTPPAWALPLIEAVKEMREEIRSADLPRWREAITAIQNDVQAVHQELAAAKLSDVKDDIETMKEQLESLPTKSYVSETLKDELKPVKADMDIVQGALDGSKEGYGSAAPGQFERTIAYTNELYISSKKSSNRMKVHPLDLQQVPAQDGTLPWNTRVRDPDGEEIVLPPLVSLDAVDSLGASQLAAYVQVYYPGHEIPEDLTERKRLILRSIGRAHESYNIV